jgi:oxalate decarboxylase/phosphoglucose isomerase-like protein (cupin superfamily)
MKTTLPSKLCFSLFVAPLLLASTFAADDRVKIDNDHARVLVVNSAPGAKSELHEHKINRVMIYLDPGKMTLTDTSGKVQTLNFKAGEALWSPATGPHVSLNVSDHPVRIVEIELKSAPGNPNPAEPAALDWVRVDPKRYKVEFENDQVRVVRAHYGPHGKGIMHEHPFDYVVAFLTDAKLQVSSPEGKSVVAMKSAGDVIAGRATKHVEENLSDKPLEVVVVEFKK